MDPFTHACSGILIGQALRPSPEIRRQTLLVLGLAALAPDVDVASYLWGSETFYRVHHVYTHTLLGVVVLAILLAKIEIFLARGITFIKLIALNLVGCTAHLLGDIIAVWPLRLLWPLGNYDFALHWTGDFDLVVLVVVGLATAIAELDGQRERAPWVLAGVVLILVGYFLWFPGWAGLQ